MPPFATFIKKLTRRNVPSLVHGDTMAIEVIGCSKKSKNDTLKFRAKKIPTEILQWGKKALPIG